MVHTRSRKEISKGDNEVECKIIISIHKDATIEFNEKKHRIKQSKDNFNVRLRWVSEHDSCSSSSNDDRQIYQPAKATDVKTVQRAWLNCKSSHKKDKQKIRASDVVLAKVRGHSAWPAIIVEVISSSRVKVQFFGADAHEKFGFVGLNEITLFKNSIDVLLLLLKKNIKKFRKAVKEAELVCGIPEECSLLNH